MDKRDYIVSLIPKEEEPLYSMREIASRTETYAPIVPSETAQLLKTLMHIIKPKRILEIGTAIGYSAILMAKNTSEDCEIITIERYEKVADIAIENIFEAGFEKKIRVIKGEAVDIINWLDGDFDLVFMDGAKGQYIEFLPRILKLLKSGGVLITDDVLYNEPNIEENATTRHRKYTIVQRLRLYLETICNHPELETTVLEVGEGIAISYKK